MPNFHTKVMTVRRMRTILHAAGLINYLMRVTPKSKLCMGMQWPTGGFCLYTAHLKEDGRMSLTRRQVYRIVSAGSLGLWLR